MFDVNKLADEVDKEVTEAAVKDAKAKLVTKQKDIRHAKRILANLDREYHSLLLEISEEIG